MKTQRSKKKPFPDLNSAEAVDRFKAAAAAFAARTNASKQAALKTLQKEGIVTATGRLSKRYS